MNPKRTEKCNNVILTVSILMKLCTKSSHTNDPITRSDKFQSSSGSVALMYPSQEVTAFTLCIGGRIFIDI